jgi:hypothetical protein
MSMRSAVRAGLFSLVAGAAVAQMPQMQQPTPIPQPAPMPTPGQPQPGQPTMPDINPNINPDNSGNAGPQPGSQGNNGQQNVGRDSGDQRNRYQNAGFIGGWCAQGDPTKQTSISYNGAFYNLTNETGDTSIGNLQGNNQIQAPGWQFVTGTLTRNGTQIQWSNGTFWARCPSGGGGGGRRQPNLNGNWYPNGNRSMQCSIQQRRGNLTLQNESGQRATGSFNGKWNISTNWQGTRINGTISRDGNRINWDNGTYWIRYRLYTQ